MSKLNPKLKRRHVLRTISRIQLMMYRFISEQNAEGAYPGADAIIATTGPRGRSEYGGRTRSFGGLLRRNLIEPVKGTGGYRIVPESTEERKEAA